MKKAGLVTVALQLLVWMGASATHAASLQPAPALDAQQQLAFWSGYSLFRSPWVSAPASTRGRDGLGPYFNAHSCHACHPDGGSGRGPEAFVIRIGDSTSPEAQRWLGQQLQPFAVGGLRAEATVELLWHQQAIQAPDSTAKLRVPVPQVELHEPQPPAPMSIRVAPPLFGVGLIDVIDEQDILSLADEHDTDEDGISGRASWVESDSRAPRLGRFGHKAEQPSLEAQVALALHEDLGLTTLLFPHQNCAEYQRMCQQMPTGDGGVDNVEVSAGKFRLLIAFLSGLPPPAVQEAPAHPGEVIFGDIACGKCHRPAFDVPKTSVFAPARIYPYSDLLLHDLGAGLSDFRTLPHARPEEWRTAPLWGLRYKLTAREPYLLHDGRARTIEEAILWHGGEAAASRERFRRLDKEDRLVLLEFLSQL